MSIINEEISVGRKYRELIDEATKLWRRYSFWTKASDVEFNSGKNAEDLISDLTDNNSITEVKVVNSLPNDAGDHPTTFYLVINN